MVKTLTGKVVSLTMPKTAVVVVSRVTRHPLYKKAREKSRKILAQNDLSDLAIGNTVRLVSTRPLSRRKHFKIVEKFN